MRRVGEQREAAADHPDRPLVGGVSLHDGLCWSSAALLQDSVRKPAAALQVRLSHSPLTLVPNLPVIFL